jgi:NADPH2:quinone reductase
VKAIVVREFGDPQVMRIEEVPVPTPASEQILVRVRAAGVNPVDTYIRRGAYARRPTLPFTPGADAAGKVEAVGPLVARFVRGDRVYVTGTIAGSYGAYAELAVCHVSQVHPLPESVSYQQGAAIGVPYGTAYRALVQRGQARPGETVLVHGASGGVGTAALQLCRAFGLVAFGTAGTDRGLGLLSEQGADQAFNHRSPDYTDQILAATDGRGVDVVIEMLANVNLDRDIALLARGGRVVIVGNRGTVEIDPRQIMARDADVRGMLLFNTPPDAMAEIHAALGAGLRAGTLKPVVGREFPLADAPLAHEAVMSPGAHGKIVVRP